MISIGNDIVDLAAIDKQRTQQKIFYAKILSATEQQLYNRPVMSKLPFETFVWLLWSAKESVYKFAKRLNPDLIFSPARIEFCSEPEFSALKSFQNLILEDPDPGSIPSELAQFLNSGSDNNVVFFHVTYLFKTYYLQSLVNTRFIATIASESPNPDGMHWGIKQINPSDYESQSAAVRSFAIKGIGAFFDDKANLSFHKSPVGYPVLLNNGNEVNLKVSFAHHGNYVAYAFAQ